MKKEFGVKILWGATPEDDDQPAWYKFKTKVELDAFLLGIEQMDGWMGYTLLKVKENGVIETVGDDPRKER